VRAAATHCSCCCPLMSSCPLWCPSKEAPVCWRVAPQRLTLQHGARWHLPCQVGISRRAWRLADASSPHVTHHHVHQAAEQQAPCMSTCPWPSHLRRQGQQGGRRSGIRCAVPVPAAARVRARAAQEAGHDQRAAAQVQTGAQWAGFDVGSDSGWAGSGGRMGLYQAALGQPGWHGARFSFSSTLYVAMTPVLLRRPPFPRSASAS
jgi:hypothetical protein